MKKKLVCMIMTGVVAGMLGGCGDSTVTPPETAAVDEAVSMQEEQTGIEEEGVATDASISGEEVSIEDFRTQINNDGTIEIDLYTGNASTVVIPDTINGIEVTQIGGFANHDELTAVVIPDTVKEISTGAFQNCFNLASVQMGENVEKIGSYAFDGTFETIELPDTLVEIRESAFNDVSLQEVKLPGNLCTMGPGAFARIDIKTLTIPGSLKVIEEQAFSGCQKLKEVIIEDGVETIEESAFEGCTELEKVVIPNSVTEIQEYAFWQSKKVVIVAEPGSCAEAFANQYGIPVQNP